MKRTLLKKLINQVETPFYLLDQDELQRTINKVKKAFSFNKGVIIAYPYKVNSLKSVCLFMKRIKLWAEVSSVEELKIAQEIGVNPTQIIYNGVYKSITDLHYAIKSKCKIHIDNFEEYERVKEIAAKLGRQIEVGVRITPRTNSNWDKFGFLINNEAERIIRIIGREKKITIYGLHTHKSTIRSYKDYENYISAFLEFASRVVSEGLAKIKYIDIGSGFCLNVPSSKNVSYYEKNRIIDYTKILENALSRYHELQQLKLIVEPGKLLVAPSMTLVTKIISIKKRLYKWIVFIDAGSNLLGNVDYAKYKIDAVTKEKGKMQKCEIQCCLCDGFAVIDKSLPLSDPKVGDVLLIRNIGGYDFTRTFFWQKPRAAVIMMRKNNFWIVRRAETYKSIWLNDCKIPLNIKK